MKTPFARLIGLKNDLKELKVELIELCKTMKGKGHVLRCLVLTSDRDVEVLRKQFTFVMKADSPFFGDNEFMNNFSEVVVW